ncbi:MAG: hypothetical protein PHW92_09245 [Lutibacter sp.]|nr:hypothetical protein [Lutibacter sp.]
MEIRIRQKQNIYIPDLRCQKFMKSASFKTDSVTEDKFVRNEINFTGLNPRRILRRFRQFGIKEYERLSEPELKALRTLVDSDGKLCLDRNVIILFSKIVKDNLDKMYPNGYVFVSIGRSPAVIGKALECQGVDVRYCPISELRYSFPPEDVLKKRTEPYKKYLESIGLSPDEIEKHPEKTYVFVDYEFSGTTLKNFERLFTFLMGKQLPNVVFKSLNKKLLKKAGLRIDLRDLTCEHLAYADFKKCGYSPVERLPFRHIEKIKRVIAKPHTENCKKMLFAIIDFLATHDISGNPDDVFRDLW